MTLKLHVLKLKFKTIYKKKINEENKFCVTVSSSKDITLSNLYLFVILAFYNVC